MPLFPTRPDGSPLRVHVTGASGFAGSYAVDHFVERGCQVTASSRRAPAWLASPKYAAVRHARADVTDADAMRRAVEGVDAVVHAAGLFDFWASERDLFATNADGVERLAAACVQGGVRTLVNFSSGSVYGVAHGDTAVDEQAATDPRDPYARSKLEGEQRLRSQDGRAGLRGFNLRLGAIYGPGSRYGDAVALRLVHQGLLFGHPGLWPARSSHVHAVDAARAAAFFVARPELAPPPGGPLADLAWNVADDCPTFNGDLLACAARALGRGARLGYHNWVRFPATVMRLLALGAEAWAAIFGGRPAFERVSIDYVTRGHAMSNARLRAAGFHFRYPDVLAALPDVARWYAATGWRVFRDPDAGWWGSSEAPGEAPAAAVGVAVNRREAMPLVGLYLASVLRRRALDPRHATRLARHRRRLH
ncbi:MAG: NAD(P)-dependent oxidoreductase, partial [Planctomycetes bacterium]|nr:NAD(P)-dependent oxidoreductase [Planctomycetota bacterium]